MNNQSVIRYFKTLAWPAIVVAIYLVINLIFNNGAMLILWSNPQADFGLCISIALMGASIVTTALLLGYKPLGLSTSYRQLGCGKQTAFIALIAIVAGLQGASILNDLMNLKNNMEDMFNNMTNSVWGISAIALFGPICEEVVFRAGIIKPMLKAGSSPWSAIITSAVVFGLIHGNPAQIFFAMLVGIVFGIVYTRTGSLIITTIGHVFNNALCVVLMLMFKDEKNEITAVDLFGGKLTTAIILLVSFSICIVMLRLMWKQTRPNEKYNP